MSLDEAAGTSRRGRYLAGTETYAEVALTLDSPQWSSVPGIMRAGKALARRRRGILAVYADGLDKLFDLDAGSGCGNSDEVAAYVAVLRDLLAGRSELSVGAEEAELSWPILAPVLQVWRAGRVPLGGYAAGGAGLEC